MELVKNKCLFCNENLSVFSKKDSNLYFRLINKNNFELNHITDSDFKKLFLGQCICIPCAFKVENINDLINFCNNEQNRKKLSSNTCTLCLEEDDCHISNESTTKAFQNILTAFHEAVIRNRDELSEWNVCVKCSSSIISWSDIKKSLTNLQKYAKMPKIKFTKTKQTANTRKVKTRAKAIDDADDEIEDKLKHLKPAHDENLNFAKNVLKDKKMLYSIPYIKINLTDSDNEIEIVDASTSKAPTKPPRKISKIALSEEKNSSELRNGDKNNEISPELLNKRRPKRLSLLKNRTPDKTEKHLCFICKEEFSSNCEKKLHELEHNISFSPVVNLKNHDFSKMKNSSQNGDIEDGSSIKTRDPTKNNEEDTKSSEDRSKRRGRKSSVVTNADEVQTPKPKSKVVLKGRKIAKSLEKNEEEKSDEDSTSRKRRNSIESLSSNEDNKEDVKSNEENEDTTSRKRRSSIESVSSNESSPETAKSMMVSAKKGRKSTENNDEEEEEEVKSDEKNVDSTSRNEVDSSQPAKKLQSDKRGRKTEESDEDIEDCSSRKRINFEESLNSDEDSSQAQVSRKGRKTTKTTEKEEEENSDNEDSSSRKRRNSTESISSNEDSSNNSKTKNQRLKRSQSKKKKVEESPQERSIRDSDDELFKENCRETSPVDFDEIFSNLKKSNLCEDNEEKSKESEKKNEESEEKDEESEKKNEGTNEEQGEEIKETKKKKRKSVTFQLPEDEDDNPKIVERSPAKNKKKSRFEENDDHLEESQVDKICLNKNKSNEENDDEILIETEEENEDEYEEVFTEKDDSKTNEEKITEESSSLNEKNEERKSPNEESSQELPPDYIPSIDEIIEETQLELEISPEEKEEIEENDIIDESNCPEIVINNLSSKRKSKGEESLQSNEDKNCDNSSNYEHLPSLSSKSDSEEIIENNLKKVFYEDQFESLVLEVENGTKEKLNQEISSSFSEDFEVQSSQIEENGVNQYEDEEDSMKQLKKMNIKSSSE